MIHKEKKETPWQNELDTKQFLVDVHSEFKKYLGIDFKLAKLTTNQKEFIMDMVAVGMISADITPNPDIGEEIKLMDYTTIQTIAILEFNQENNMIIDRLTDYAQREEEKAKAEQEETEWFKKFKKKMQEKKED